MRVEKKVSTGTNIYWFDENGARHREDGPAVESYNGDKYWYIHGTLHREDGPAIEHSNGNKCWYFNARFHREDGPAVERNSGHHKEWYIHGVRHREDGPAVEYPDGGKEWWFNNQRHREDGPAIEYPFSPPKWFIKDMGVEEFCDRNIIPYVYKNWPIEYKILWKLCGNGVTHKD